MKHIFVAQQAAVTARMQVVRLQNEIADALVREGAKTNVPCPVADRIFDQLFGNTFQKIALQGTPNIIVAIKVRVV
jgi:hypothetical protein